MGDGGHVRVDLVEPEGWAAEIEVVDERGLAVPFASLEVSGDSEYASLDHGTQTLGLRTNVAGRARLPGLAGVVVVRARFGSRSASAEVDAGHPTVRLELSR